MGQKGTVFVTNTFSNKSNVNDSAEIDKFNSLLKNNVDPNISTKINVINYSDTSITLECDDSSISSIIKFESEKYVQIFKDHGMYNIREIKVKLTQFQRSE